VATIAHPADRRPAAAAAAAQSGSTSVSLHDVLVPVVSLLVLVVPGLVLALLAGLRPTTSVVVAPLLTYGLVTAAATVASYVSFPWQPWTLALGTVLVGAVVVGLRLLTGRGQPWRRRVTVERPARPGPRDLAVIGGVLLGGAVAAAVFRTAFGRLDALNQDWDYVFHANAVRLIADTGDVAPAAMARINEWESTSFYYPNSYHALGAVVRDLTGAGVFEVLNSQTMLVGLIAGLGLAGVLHRAGAPLAVTATTPVLLAGFSSFPYDVLWRGPLLPYAIGVALIPAVVVLLDVALDRRRPAPTLALALGAAGLLGLHPSTALSAGLFVLVHLLVRWGRTPSAVLGDLAVLVSGGVAALVVAAPAVRGALTTGSQAAEIDWPAISSTGQAVGDLLFLNHGAAAPQYWLALPVVVGILSLIRAPWSWAWTGGALIGGALFVAAAASDSELVGTLTGPWWNDRWRFAALAVLGLAPLAALGLVTAADTAQQVLRRLTGSRLERLPHRSVAAALVVAGLVVLAVVSDGLYATRNYDRVAANHQDDHTLDRDEVSAMRWLADHSTGGTVMNDPNDGSAYLLAETGLRPLFGHVINPPAVPSMGRTQALLLERFNCLDADPAVRTAVADLDIRYVFLGSGYVRPEFERLPGLRGLSTSPSLELVHRAPGVQVFEVHLGDDPTGPVAACQLPDPDGGNGSQS